MTAFQSLLTLYYLCDQTAAARALAGHEVALCMANYERLKMQFVEEPHALPGSPDRAAQIRAGYAAFKSWEARNPDHVGRLRGAALQRLRAAQ